MDFRDKKAIYLQIVDYVCEKILLNQWPPGERIPSVRDLGVELEVNPNTAMRSYDFLQQKDIIYNKRGIGYFAADEAPVHIKAYRREQFMTTELPQFFRTLYLLNISMEDIEDRYKTFIKTEFDPNWIDQ
ncbi:DNA-binding transcriptional regulator YhcF (GntR family) [Larkinella arboricola]|uniref:DNA-binding transcriptional regulator YhcF (GntR family) n=1 Tax=Larkinella arboricola TaxID=643671 RepID=A0A327WP26_LARAB|nr:GntR family transcriptional regulator [Larkinella arboricola]RAJ92282.1 DNA-binding transcriptional regulator YhcF (GntR family) [Larkinella arboricola]